MSDYNLSKLNELAFQQLDRLSTATGSEAIESEIERSKAFAGIASKVIDTANIAVKGYELQLEYGAAGNKALPSLLADSK